MPKPLAPIGASFPLPRSEMVFTAVQETSRTYVFPGGDKVTIANAVEMHVSPSNGHRVLDKDGVSHYVPSGWVHIYWTVPEGAPHFAA